MPRSNAYGIGSINLKGKLSKLLRCGCCEAFNCKQDELKKEHAKEINAYLKGVNHADEH